MDALVQWNTSPEGNVVEYRVYHGYPDVDGTPTYFEFFTVPVPGVSKSFTGLDDFRRHHFAVTAINTVPLESGFSVDVSKRVSHRFTLR